MRRLTAFAFAAALFLAPGSARAQNGAAGDWNVTFETPQGPQTVTVSLKLDGDKATGQLSTPMGAVPVTGTATADAFNLSATIDFQGNAFTLGLIGKVTGDSVAGSVKAGDLGEFPFTGKRATPAAAASATVPGAAPAAAAATAGDASGRWNIVLDLAGNPFAISATFKQEGDKISGTFSSPAGETPVSGTMSGRALKLEFKAQTPQGELPITMTGDLGADEGFVGKASIAGLGEANWTGKRAN